MSPVENEAKPQERESVETVVGKIRYVLGDLCRSVMVVSRIVDGEIAGVVIGDTPDDDYISSQELADGAVYILVGVGKIPTDEYPAGVVIVTS